jgi:hypothetical protein
MNQFDMFGEDLVPAPLLRALAPTPTYPAAIEIEPVELKLRVAPELDAWTRETQRIHIIAHARDLTRLREAGDAHRVHCIIQNAPYVLLKLNGLGGQW